jgi:hypothetical protein
MKLYGGMPRGKFITRAQPAEKEDRTRINQIKRNSKEDLER